MAEGIPYDISSSSEGAEVTIDFPAFPYDSFNQKGNINPWILAKLFESGRYVGCSAGFVSCVRLVAEGRTLFLVSQDITTNRNLKSISFLGYIPYQTNLKLHSYGASSMTWQQTLTNKVDGKILATAKFRMVLVDLKTRRSTGIPEWFHEKYNKYVSEKTVSPRVVIPSVPPSAFCQQITVQESDTDPLKHFNNTAYIKYSCDVISAACRQGRIKHFKESINDNYLSEFEAVYTGEARVGQQINVFSWQNDDNPAIIHTVMKRESRSIFYAKMKFELEQQSKL